MPTPLTAQDYARGFANVVLEYRAGDRPEAKPSFLSVRGHPALNLQPDLAALVLAGKQYEFLLPCIPKEFRPLLDELTPECLEECFETCIALTFGPDHEKKVRRAFGKIMDAVKETISSTLTAPSSAALPTASPTPADSPFHSSKSGPDSAASAKPESTSAASQ